MATAAVRHDRSRDLEGTPPVERDPRAHARSHGIAYGLSPAGGLREWLETVDAPPSKPAAAAFDTRSRSRGYPAPPRGAQRSVSGGSVSGEVERARRWAEQVAVHPRGAASPAERVISR